MHSHYQQLILESAARLGLVGRVNPAHVEYLMRAQYSTLDHLSSRDFDREVSVCYADLRSCDQATIAMIDRGARADGLI